MNAGRVFFDIVDKMWKVSAPPHLVLKLKRVFPQINRHERGTLSLSDTEEVARDLEWFLSRHPLAMSTEDAQRMGGRAAGHRERESIVDAMLAKRRPPPSFDLALPPRDYQALAAGLCLQAGGLLLADDLGLGKTVSSICMLADQRALPALIVTMAHLPRQWEAEINRFAPKLTTHILKTGKPYDLTVRPRRGRKTAPSDADQLALADAPPSLLPDVIISSYHKLDGWSTTLAPLVRSVVYDEIQELRHPDSLRYSASKWISRHASYRLGLSATPINNYGIEFFHVLDILFPGQLGTFGEFVTEWTGGGKALNDPDAFGSYLRKGGYMLRRSRADVGRELPKLTKVIEHVNANTEALNEVSAACAELARIILSQGGPRGAQMQAAGELDMRLRQATGIAKAPYVANFVRMLVESGEKVVLYGWHRDVYSIWLDKLADLNPVMYTGSESAAAKEKSKEAFVRGDAKVLIISLRAGAGLDGLQHACKTVVFGELDWSPAVHEQDIGRVDRDGQKDPVFAYFLISNEGSDPVIVDILGLKRQQIDGVRKVQVDLVERLETDGERIKKLAREFLAKNNLPLPVASAPADGAAA